MFRFLGETEETLISSHPPPISPTAWFSETLGWVFLLGWGQPVGLRRRRRRQRDETKKGNCQPSPKILQRSLPGDNQQLFVSRPPVSGNYHPCCASCPVRRNLVWRKSASLTRISIHTSVGEVSQHGTDQGIPNHRRISQKIEISQTYSKSIGIP